MSLLDQSDVTGGGLDPYNRYNTHFVCKHKEHVDGKIWKSTIVLLFYLLFITADFVNDKIEERVTVLEFQMGGVIDDVTDLEEGLTLVETEQIIQDERILELESDTSSKYL